MASADDDSTMIDCDEHGRTVSSIVCRHHIDSLAAVGFIENSDDPDDLQAWCAACEAKFADEGELTEAFRAFCEFAVVCTGCYDELKRRHTAAKA